MHAYHGNFEVHLTVRADGSLDAFRAWCDATGCKCVRIVLARGSQVDQPMATWRRGGTGLPVVLGEALYRAAALESAGIEVVRLKIEADPSNEDVPADDESTLLRPSENHFEHHVKLRRATDAECDVLLRTCLEHEAHLSRNAWHRISDGCEERFVTQRSHRVGRSAATARVQRLLDALAAIGEEVVELQSEYVVHDTNLALDVGWLPVAAT